MSPERTPYWALEIELRTGLAKFRTPYWSTEFSKSGIFKIPDSGPQSGILLRTQIPYSSTGRSRRPPPLSAGKTKGVRNLGKNDYRWRIVRSFHPPVPDNAKHPLAGAFNGKLD